MSYIVFGLIAAIIFVLAYPFILDKLFTLLKEKSRIPVYVLITSLAILLYIGGTELSHAPPPDPLLTYTFLAVLVTISALAVVMPYICFTRLFFTPALSGRMKTLSILTGSLFQIPFLAALLINPERTVDAALPPLFAEYLPGLGHIFDAVATALGFVGQAGYDLIFTVGVTLGFYIEVAIVSTIFWAIFSLFSKSE
ncbi:hypothetical protein [Methanogenium organophilum]|uniref:Uncharacterized protein n=1 Tax=Methanogenium organophilum TaxID=2199 RepID=A0A9X9T7J3_METOG|nr:hypothetical protein [Methanogenium organophilum]WAI01448.1 hypothetical protein OU421_00830 [Methanogenium organophilum]